MLSFQNEYECQDYIRNKLPPQVWSTHVEPVGDFGHPDLHVWTNEKMALIELKCVVNLNTTIKKTFTEYQIPWYVRYRQRGGDVLYLVTWVKEGNTWMIYKITDEIYNVNMKGKLSQFDWSVCPDIIGWICGKLYV